MSAKQKKILEEFRETETGDECPAVKGFFTRVRDYFAAADALQSGRSIRKSGRKARPPHEARRTACALTGSRTGNIRSLPVTDEREREGSRRSRRASSALPAAAASGNAAALDRSASSILAGKSPTGSLDEFATIGGRCRCTARPQAWSGCSRPGRPPATSHCSVEAGERAHPPCSVCPASLCVALAEPFDQAARPTPDSRRMPSSMLGRPSIRIVSSSDLEGDVEMARLVEQVNPVGARDTAASALPSEAVAKVVKRLGAE